MNIKVVLPKNRFQLGKLTVEGSITADGETKPWVIAGPYDCLGRADQFLATKAGNPERDPAKTCGDTPLGTFTANQTGPGPSLRSYGPNPRILLQDVPGRVGIMIHGGAPGNNGGLRPTEGCIRVSNDDMLKILNATKQATELKVEIVNG